MIAASVLGGGLIYGIVFTRSSLNQAIKDLSASQHKIDSALIGINAARAEIHDLQTKTDSFQDYTHQIGNSVNALDARMAASNALFSKKMADINKSISLITDSIRTLTSDTFPHDIPRGILKNAMNK